MSATADGSFSTAAQGGGNSEAQHLLQTFWPRVMEEIRNLTPNDFKMQDLPLARIKKIMKLDEDVKMISAEAPVLFAKAAQIFITELSLRAWIHTEDNKRRTLQRNDIAMAITKFDQFDFLIDIVPRDELKPPKRQLQMLQRMAVEQVFLGIIRKMQDHFIPKRKKDSKGSKRRPWLTSEVKDNIKIKEKMYNIAKMSGKPEDWATFKDQQKEEVRQAVPSSEQVQYYFTLAQQPTTVQVQGQQQAQASGGSAIQPSQIIIGQAQQGQVQGATVQQLQQVQVAQSQTAATAITSAPVTMQVGDGQQVQLVPAQNQTQAAQTNSVQTMQVMQQIITNTGEIQQIPVQLNAGQLQYIRLAQPVSGAQVVQGQIQTLAPGNPQQVSQAEVQQGQQQQQQQYNQFTDGQQLYQIQQVTMPAGQDITQPMFIQSTNQTVDGQTAEVTE
ncbi:nuclear transcription factor Y subunit gamma isoform X1 [Leucoraja erinacea]|uniref:nuclear transcription factor Y subunit gamma isoform X1 n=1 Tax=Leucoraja erinaceus TaxID=7782 RepID=UPI0024537D6B|nr:nuclear transcription factor Y subunit gamma isoform X1 [Leucoraja erinacea]XP_055512093.1 nuclear transcription factor Y subunit gamma isoform X1 [Leucoraja erinacea]